MNLKPGMLLRSVDDVIGTGFPNAENVILKDRLCMFLNSRPFSRNQIHYQLLVLDYNNHPIVDDVIVSPADFFRWFQVVTQTA